MKEERKRRAGEGLDMVPLAVPLGRGSQMLCRHPAPLMEWKGNFSSSALRENPGTNRHYNLAFLQVEFCPCLNTERWNAFPSS